MRRAPADRLAAVFAASRVRAIAPGELVDADIEAAAPSRERLLRLGFITLLAVFALGGVAIVTRNTDAAILSLHDLDEYAFLLVVSRMLEGIKALDPMRALNISFYSYGYGFFTPLLAISAPFTNARAYDLALIAMRGLSLACTVGLLALAGRWLKARTGSWAYGIVAVLALSTMLAFLHQAVWIHPEAMMSLVLLALFVAAGSMDLGRWHTLVFLGALAGLALATKLQAVIYLPFVGLLVMYRAAEPVDGDPARRALAAIRTGAVFAAAAVAVYLVLTPILFHPVGLGAFLKDLTENLESNRTNHFSGHLPSAADKLAMLARELLPLSIALLAIAAVTAGAVVRRVPLRERAPELTFLAAGLVTAAYLFVTVEKTWAHYYGFSYILLVLGFMALAAPILRRTRYEHLALAAVGALALVVSTTRLPAFIGPYIEPQAADAATAAHVAALVKPVLPTTAAPHILISPRTPFAFDALGLSISQVAFIAGPLDFEQHDAVELIILRRNDEYFLPASLARTDIRGRNIVEARRNIDLAIGGQRPDFRLCASDPVVLILCNRRQLYPPGIRPGNLPRTSGHPSPIVSRAPLQ